ncbi:peptidase [Acanthamoeba castellanii str. Neff]|uniref:Peptidase n=1 Tax=Acanthamoeba castellanii (strain ATCC 30010 / Neff) TaxID=1257118 RepID=L8GUR0_ACACF|nr:peptidase [Acanthamoeba castellanii str. Neff]ELR16735.1 peptidase [Acanthamoeba castellanii str. Neff]
MSKASYLDTDLGMVVDAQAYMVANTSCRGPSVLRTLKLDITAPGVDILAQGYGPTLALASIEFSVQSALMKQIWPGWTLKQVKAAFMGSAKWKGVISNSMGIGLNLAGAINPGALLDPPSLSFSYLTKGQQTREVLREHTVMTGGRVFLSGALAPVLARPVINSNSDTSLIKCVA